MQNRQMGTFRLGFFFTGCFLGAGYLSGREIWEFFGDRGFSGFLFIVPSVAVMLITGLAVLFLAEKTGKRSAEELVIPFRIPAVKTVFTLIQTLFLINIAVIMTSGAAALIRQLFGISGIIGGIVFCTLTVLCSLTGVRGVIRVFSSTVPVLAVFVVVMTVITYCKTDVTVSFPVSKPSGTGALTVTALVYASYNLFGSVQIIASASGSIRSRRARCLGFPAGALLMIVIAMCVFLCQLAMPSSISEELPLLAVAQSYGRGWGIAFGVMLLGAMFGTALSTVVAANEMSALKWTWLKKYPVPVAIAELLMLLLGSFLGFSELISVVYPIFGYAGLALIALLLAHCVLVILRRRRAA